MDDIVDHVYFAMEEMIVWPGKKASPLYMCLTGRWLLNIVIDNMCASKKLHMWQSKSNKIQKTYSWMSCLKWQYKQKPQEAKIYI